MFSSQNAEKSSEVSKNIVETVVEKIIEKVDKTNKIEVKPEILEKIIKRNIALEYNTGGLNEKCHFCNVQNEELFTLYKSLGGKLVTVGSDAHHAVGIGLTFKTATDHLKKLGFDSVYYYENRKPQMIKI